MSLRALAVFAVLAAALLLPAAPARAQAAPSCLATVPAVERYNGIPAGLLVAIGFVESDYDGQPWPWTLNIGGAPYYLRTASDAARLMRDRNGALRLDVAVGCMQIYMRYHAKVFPHPEDLLDPRLNVAYAGWYLAELHDEYGSWTAAVAHYGAHHHEAQRDYVCKVLHYRIALGYQSINEAAEQLCGIRLLAYGR